MNIGDKIIVTNFEGFSKKEIKKLIKLKFTCTVEDVGTHPCTDCNTGTIQIVYTNEFNGFPLLTGDFKIK